MVDIVERLKEAHPNSAQRWAGSTILLDAAAEIQRLRAEVEELRTIVAKPAVDRAETRESLFPELSARIAAERGQATAEAMERAAQIAETVYPELSVYAGGPEWSRHGRRIAAAIRAEASKKGGEGK